MCRSCSTSSPPFELAPISESVQIAVTAASGSTAMSSSATIAEKLGGYEGVPGGVPVIELQISTGQEQHSGTSTTPTVPASPSYTKLAPPLKPSGWMMRCLICLQMLLTEIRTSTPSKDFIQLLDSSSPDDIACALKSDTIDSAFLAVQENAEVLRRSLTRILLRCASGLFPSLLQLGFAGGEFPAVLFNLWKHSASAMLSLTE